MLAQWQPPLAVTSSEQHARGMLLEIEKSWRNVSLSLVSAEAQEGQMEEVKPRTGALPGWLPRRSRTWPKCSRLARLCTGRKSST
jgi:hypothetical protein